MKIIVLLFAALMALTLITLAAYSPADTAVNKDVQQPGLISTQKGLLGNERDSIAF